MSCDGACVIYTTSIVGFIPGNRENAILINSNSTRVVYTTTSAI